VVARVLKRYQGEAALQFHTEQEYLNTLGGALFDSIEGRPKMVPVDVYNGAESPRCYGGIIVHVEHRVSRLRRVVVNMHGSHSQAFAQMRLGDSRPSMNPLEPCFCWGCRFHQTLTMP